MLKSRSGFTIVELLIVIVVIAILAAITIVAYNGVQDRAEASKTAAAVQAYKKALTLYKVDTGLYPTTGAMCLGDQYSPFTSQSSPACRYSTSPVLVSNSIAPLNVLKPYLGGQLPMPSMQFLHDSSGREYVGGHFYGSAYNLTLDGKPVVMIEYHIKSSTCPVGPVYSSAGWPNLSSPAVPRTSGLSDGSVCDMTLPNE